MSNKMYDGITGRSPIATDDLGYIGTGQKASQIISNGTTDYNDLSNKPTINNVELSGNKTSSDLGLQSALTEPQTAAVNSGITAEDVEQITTNKTNISLIEHASGTKIFFGETQPTGTISVGSYWISTNGIAVYGGTATASTYTVTFTADSGTLYNWTITGNATQASTATPTSPVAVLGVGDLVSSGEHSGEYDISITCGGETNHVYIADMLRKIESYADSVSKTTVSRRIKKITLTGAETINGVRANSDNTAYCCTLRYSDIGMSDIIDNDKYMDTISYPKYISTHFVNKAVIENTTYYAISVGEMGANSATSAQNRYIILCVSGLTTAQDYTDWLTTQYNNGTPVEIYYIAATATETSITTPDIPTIDGSNTFTVGTTVNPSTVSVSYVGWTTAQ